MLILEYALTEKEFLDYYFYTGWQSSYKKSHRVKYYATNLVIFFLLIGFSLYAFNDGKFDTTSFIIWGIWFAIAALLMVLRMRSIFNKHGKKLLKESGQENILPQLTLTINEKGIFNKSKVSETQFLWNAFTGKVIINNCYYLYINRQQALVIPHRVFQSPEEKEKFDRILSEYFPLQAELKSLSS